MMNLKNFSVYTPEKPAFDVDAIYIKAETGEDWYQVQKLFADDTVKVMYREDGFIATATKDVTTLFPAMHSVVELHPDAVPSDVNTPGKWAFVDGKIIIREKPIEEVVAFNTAKRKQLLREASDEVAALEDAETLGESTDEEVAMLKSWRAYRVAVSRVDTSLVDVEWPKKPS